MENFVYDITTKILFGKGQIENLGKEIKRYTDSVLLVYGGGSIKRNGIYDAAVAQLQQNGIRFVELPGVEPNPRVATVAKGAALCREHKLGGVLAVGGGSSIDCAKVIAGAVDYDGNPWDLVVGKAPYKTILPVFSVLTLSATGSEMDPGAVISDPDTSDKRGTSHPGMLPKVSVLDPEYTYTVPQNQTAAGTADIMSHVMEQYFSVDESAYVSDRISEGLLKTCIHYAPIALREPDNYEARANLMWASSLGINGLAGFGKARRWSVHGIEHMLSAYYDITHGVGLAILTPNWMDFALNEETLPRFVRYGVNVWDIDSRNEPMMIAKESIARTRRFFTEELGLPATLREVGIDETHLAEMSTRAFGEKGLAGGFVPMSAADIETILKNSL